MKLVMKLIIILGNLFYSIVKCFPTKKKITFISRQHDKSNVDFDLLIEEIKEQHIEYEVCVLAKMIGPSILDKIKYVFHMIRQMYHIATSEVVVLDTYCLVISLFKQKQDLKVIQIWHAVGAFKKFGYSTLDKPEGASRKIAEMMRMHKNYDFVCTSSEYCRPFFAEAFHIDKEKVVVSPLPHLDILKDRKSQEQISEKVYKKYPRLQNSQKSIVIYVPTHRKEDEDMSEPLLQLIDNFDFQRYELIVKLHPLSKHHVKDCRVIFDEVFDSHEIMIVADYVLTDYSAIVFEAAILDKCLLFYSFDYESYALKRDFYFNYKEELPGIIFEDASLIQSALEESCEEIEKVRAFNRKYVADSRESYTKDLCHLIFEVSK